MPLPPVNYSFTSSNHLSSILLIKVKLSIPLREGSKGVKCTQRVPQCLINLSGAILEACGSGNPFIIEAETGLISSQCLSVQRAPTTNTTGASSSSVAMQLQQRKREGGAKSVHCLDL